MGWNFRMERESKMWDNRTEILKITFKFKRCTPWYVILEETKRDKIILREGQRPMRYEERIRNTTNILKEC